MDEISKLLDLKPVKISVVIPTIKPEKQLQNQVAKIRETVAEDCEIIVESHQQSAAKNRNACINTATGDIIIMLDDDIDGFYKGWYLSLAYELWKGDYSIVSARVLNRAGQVSKDFGMLGGSTLEDTPVQVAESQGLNIVCSACIAFQKTELRFDENYIGSGYEDTDFCMQHIKKYPDKKIVIANTCKLKHYNEAKGQQGTKKHNKNYFNKKWALNIG